MNSTTNCQPSHDNLILPSLSDEKCSPNGRYSPREQNKDSQLSNSTVELPFHFFVVSPNNATLPQKCFFANIGTKMGSVLICLFLNFKKLLG